MYVGLYPNGVDLHTVWKLNNVFNMLMTQRYVCLVSTYWYVHCTNLFNSGLFYSLLVNSWTKNSCTDIPWTKSDHFLAQGTGDTLRTARRCRCWTLHPLIHAVHFHYVSARLQEKKPSLLRQIVFHLEKSSYLLQVLKTTPEYATRLPWIHNVQHLKDRFTERWCQGVIDKVSYECIVSVCLSIVNSPGVVIVSKYRCYT